MYHKPNVSTDLATIIRRWLRDNFQYELEFGRSFSFLGPEYQPDSVFTAKIKFERHTESNKFVIEDLELFTLYIDKCVLVYWCYTGKHLQIDTECSLVVASPTFFDDLKKSLHEITNQLISYGYCLPLKQNGY